MPSTRKFPLKTVAQPSFPCTFSVTIYSVTGHALAVIGLELVRPDATYNLGLWIAGGVPLDKAHSVHDYDKKYGRAAPTALKQHVKMSP